MFWISADAKVGSDFLKSYPFEVRGLAGPRCAPPSERRNRPARENRSDVDLHFVDQALVQCLAENVATAFDRHARDIFRSEIGQNCGQRRVPVYMGVLCETIGKNARI